MILCLHLILPIQVTYLHVLFSLGGYCLFHTVLIANNQGDRDLLCLVFYHLAMSDGGYFKVLLCQFSPTQALLNLDQSSLPCNTSSYSFSVIQFGMMSFSS